MRRAVVVAACASLAAVATSAAANPRSNPVPRWLVPNAVAFADATHGALGTGYPYSGRARGAIELTSDGGRDWRVALQTPRPVLKLATEGSRWYAQLDDGETLESSDSGHHWKPTATQVWPSSTSTCPMGLIVGVLATPADPTWSVCSTSGGAGNEGKAVFRLRNSGWKRVACTNFATTHLPCGEVSYGGISGLGYPLGVAGNATGFGLIWESRGTLWVTNDGGRHWRGLEHLVQFDVDIGSWASVLPRGGSGFAITRSSSSTRLLKTTDAGRTWRVAHRWR
jgi:hypothetical protein